jgi:hypothetical protein
MEHNPKATLKSVLSEELKSSGVQLDESAWQQIQLAIQLKEGDSDESQEERSIRIKEGPYDEVTATHFSFYNLVDVDFYDLLGLGLDAAPIMMMGTEPKVKIILAILKVLHSFYPKLEHEFNETDSRILLVIADLGEGLFTQEAVEEAYEEQYGIAIDPKRLYRALGYFRKKSILRHIKDGKYRLEEKVNYDR